MIRIARAPVVGAMALGASRIVVTAWYVLAVAGHTVPPTIVGEPHIVPVSHGMAFTTLTCVMIDLAVATGAVHGIVVSYQCQLPVGHLMAGRAGAVIMPGRQLGCMATLAVGIVSVFEQNG